MADFGKIPVFCSEFKSLLLEDFLCLMGKNISVPAKW